MDNSSSLQPDPLPTLAHVAPLTQRKKDGSQYKRPPDVETEIAEVLATALSTWSLTKLKSETLVHLARWLWSRNDQRMIGKVIDCLGKRIAQIARDFSSGLGKSVADDFATEIAEELNILIFTKVANRQSDFLECAFRTAVKCRAINQRAKLRDRLKHEKSESSLPAIDDEGEEIGLVESHKDSELGPVEKAMDTERIRRGLAAVSNPLHREAVVLHYLQGWQLTNANKTIPTLSTHFGKSGRQIQNWLTKAIAEMRTALGDAI